MKTAWQWWYRFVAGLYASLCFYTSFPLPYLPNLDFQSVSRFAPLVGLLIGFILSITDDLLGFLNVSNLTKNCLIVMIWLGITGGLHLDGAMDTADGLAVTNPERRLEVMADSATGAFGAMVAIAILLLKTVSLSEISEYRGFILMAVCGWSRWGQVWAIWRYPYLKPTGKGAFHKQAIDSAWWLLPGFLVLIIMSMINYVLNPTSQIISFVTLILGIAIAFITGAWFNYKLQGHTGDTYGAVVEWTETLILCGLTTLT